MSHSVDVRVWSFILTRMAVYRALNFNPSLAGDDDYYGLAYGVGGKKEERKKY